MTLGMYPNSHRSAVSHVGEGAKSTTSKVVAESFGTRRLGLELVFQGPSDAPADATPPRRWPLLRMPRSASADAIDKYGVASAASMVWVCTNLSVTAAAWASVTTTYRRTNATRSPSKVAPSSAFGGSHGSATSE